jgi:hypothetical protein
VPPGSGRRRSTGVFKWPVRGRAIDSSPDAPEEDTMAQTLLMPKATAVWLVENTSLTFDQIADFCALHPLEVKAIADGEAATGIKGLDPITTGQLTREELDKALKNPGYKLRLAELRVRIPEKKASNKRYTPLSRRQDRPNAILWLVRNHPELKDAQIIRLIGTTKATIAAIRERTHWNASQLQPMDPVTLGLCTQIELDFEVKKAVKDKPGEQSADTGPTLISAAETTAAAAKKSEDLDAGAIFAKLKQLKGADEE